MAQSAGDKDPRSGHFCTIRYQPTIKIIGKIPMTLSENTADLRDVLDKLQEEMAECIQSAAKIKSYGLMDAYSGKTNQQHLETELGDVLCLMNILVDNRVLDHHNIELACWEKAEKMKKWAPTVAKYWKGEE